MIKFIHITDIHASRERLSQTLHILKTLTVRCKKGDIVFIIFAGDFWESTITATKGSGFSDIILAIRELENYAFLYFIYGTPSHEPSGSLDAFISGRTMVFSNMSVVTDFETETEFVFIPEPRRSKYISESSEKTTEAINKDINEFIREIGGTNQKQRIVVYHGEVKGAVYQNGASASSPTAISKELLQSLNADYYAFGHIHMPQEVWKNAWYPGSACPKDFGETHDGCYNLVTIENGRTKVERVSFGLPTFETHDIFFSDITKTDNDFSNKHIRLRFNCTKEEKKSLGVKKICEEIKERTHALSVKLEPNVIESKTAERSDVVKHKSIIEKMNEYAKEKSLKMPKKAKELLQDIQNNTLIKYSFPQHSFELLSLSLRGAIGIRDGQHKEDFELNFEKYEDGVVCLIGNCGKGKSTLIENSHPYPCMLSRDGTLKDHFYLKDSHRILLYKDENGTYYKISMLIDGKTVSGKTSYFVETSKDRETWTPLPEVDGSLDAYKKWVNSTFGSIDVFLRTAFFAKEQTKDATDISDTTKSERMELLSKLAGTDYLKEVSVIAREKRKESEAQSHILETEVESYSRYEDNIKANSQSIESWNTELADLDNIVTSSKKKVSELRIKDAEYQKAKAVTETNRVLKEQYLRQYHTTKELFCRIENAVNNASVFDKVEASNKIITGNTPLIENLMKKSDEVNKKIEKLTDDTIKKQKAASEKKISVGKIEAEIKVCKSQVIDIEEVCPTCGQPISEHKKQELLFYINKSKDKLKSLSDILTKERASLKTIEASVVKIEKKRDSLADERKEIESNLDDLRSKSDSAQEFIQSLDDIYTKCTYDDVVNERQRLKKELDELNRHLDEIPVENNLENVSDELAEAERQFQSATIRKTEISAMIKAAQKENERYQKELDSVADKKKQIKELEETASAYLFIENAFSNNGIPAIELRESAPEIADIANKILADSYGNKFEIRFGSSSELKAKRKANEDFNIIVYDSENGDEKTIDLVSSGERIWLKQALFYAFSIVQMNRTGFNFRTRLIDESDGSLDGGLRPKYLKMVTAAHAIASARVTVLITHSQEIKDIAQQIIEI